MINLQGGDQPLELCLQSYLTTWERLDMSGINPVAATLSWKVINKSGLFWNLKNLSQAAEQVHIGTVDERFIASVVLKAPINETMWIIKILERRPGSDDVLGLDSIDYLVDDIELLHETFKGRGYDIHRESNDMHEWLSLRFGPQGEFEAKFVEHIVLEVAIKELEESTQSILSHIKSI